MTDLPERVRNDDLPATRLWTARRVIDHKAMDKEGSLLMTARSHMLRSFRDTGSREARA